MAIGHQCTTEGLHRWLLRDYRSTRIISSSFAVAKPEHVEEITAALLLCGFIRRNGTTTVHNTRAEAALYFDSMGEWVITRIGLKALGI